MLPYTQQLPFPAQLVDHKKTRQNFSLETFLQVLKAYSSILVDQNELAVLTHSHQKLYPRCMHCELHFELMIQLEP
jgi:hypothetical protein